MHRVSRLAGSKEGKGHATTVRLQRSRVLLRVFTRVVGVIEAPIAGVGVIHRAAIHRRSPSVRALRQLKCDQIDALLRYNAPG